MNLRTILSLSILIFLSANLVLGDSSEFDENHWLTEHQGLNSSTSKNINRKLDKIVKALSKQLTRDSEAKRESIAVSQFLTADNKVTMLGKILSIKLVNSLSKSKKFIPVERDFTFMLTEEMKLGMSGLVEDKTVQNAGRFLGASNVLIGTIGTLGDDVVIDARLIKTETSQVMAAAETSFQMNPDIDKLLAYKIEIEPAPVHPDKEKPSEVAQEPAKDQSSPAAQENQAPQQTTTLVLTQDFYEARYKLSAEDRKEEEEKERVRRMEDAEYYKKREAQLEEVDKKIAVMNSEAAAQRREREAVMDRAAKEPWERRQRQIADFNRHRIIVFNSASQRRR